MSLAAENEKLTFTNTAPSEANFETKCKGVLVTPTADVHIAFDGVADKDDLLLKANVTVDITYVEFTRLSAIGNAGSGILYIMARR